MDALETLFTRRSIRQYTDAPVSDADLAVLLKAAMAAPSANNRQPWQFLVVRDQARREALARVHPYAQMAPKAPLCIVVCGEPAREKTPGFWVQDCAAAVQNILLAARALYPKVEVERPLLLEIARTCLEVGVDGHRGDIIMLKCAKTLAALDGRALVESADITTSAELVLPHRVRRQPLMEIADNVAALRERAAAKA